MLGKLQQGKIRKTFKQNRTESTEAMHIIRLRVLFKVQPVDKKQCRLATDSLNYLQESLPKKNVPQKWHRITHRVLVDPPHRCMRRTAPDEMNLATHSHPQDTTKDEFVRTFRSVTFPGLSLVRRYEPVSYTHLRAHETLSDL
eukprot:12427909-Karenia_brevis.AAC.1